MFVAWTIGFTIYFRKRYKRRERHRLVAAGRATPKETDLDILRENVIIPPDPAILLGQCKPGEVMIPDPQNSRYTFSQLLPAHRGFRQEKHRDAPIVTEKISSPLVNVHAEATPAKAEELEEDLIDDEMTVPMKV